MDVYLLPKIEELVNAQELYKTYSTVYQKTAYYQIQIGDKDKPYSLFEGGDRSVMVIVVGNGLGDTSSNPGQDWLRFT